MQHCTFARHGWATAPPKPGELLRRMVQKAEAAYRGARGLRPSYDVDDYNPDGDPTFSHDGRTRLPGAHTQPPRLARHSQSTAAARARIGRSAIGTAPLHAARAQPCALLAG